MSSMGPDRPTRDDETNQSVYETKLGGEEQIMLSIVTISLSERLGF